MMNFTIKHNSGPNKNCKCYSSRSSSSYSSSSSSIYSSDSTSLCSSSCEYIIHVEQLKDIQQMNKMYQTAENFKETIDFINKINDKVNHNRFANYLFELIFLNIIHKLDVNNTANHEILRRATILINKYNYCKNNNTNSNNNRAYYYNQNNIFINFSDSYSNSNSNGNGNGNSHGNFVDLPNIFSINY